jgi:hypothetical protein
MAKVHLTTVLPVPARMVWDTIGGFNSLAKWHPAVARSDESKEGAATVRRLDEYPAMMWLVSKNLVLRR